MPSLTETDLNWLNGSREVSIHYFAILLLEKEVTISTDLNFFDPRMFYA